MYSIMLHIVKMIYDKTYEEINDNNYVYETNILQNTENKEYMTKDN